MVATKLECKCHSGLSYNVISNSWAQLTAAWNVRTQQFASTLIENDSGVFPLGGENCGVSTHTHRSAMELILWDLTGQFVQVIEKTRPVAILSTTLQHYFRLYLNATCAVCARSYTGKRRTQKQTSKNVFVGLFCVCLPADVPEIVSAVFEPWLQDFSFRTIREKGKGKGTTGEIEVILFCLCPKRPKKSNPMGSSR